MHLLGFGVWVGPSRWKLYGRVRGRRRNSAFITCFPMPLVYTLAGFAFGCGLAEQETLDDSRHFIASFFAVDALDEGLVRFGIVRRRHGKTVPDDLQAAADSLTARRGSL